MLTDSMVFFWKASLIITTTIITIIKLVITSHKLPPKTATLPPVGRIHDPLYRFKNILAAGKDKVKTIVYMENSIHETPTLGFRKDVTIVSFQEIISR